MADTDIYNPKPYDDDLILPMPNGGSMVFRPVFIGEGDDPFALREFKVGDRSTGEFDEYPTSVVIGGSFVENNPNGQPDWLYYIGKYEVTAAQYYSIMDPEKASDSQFPIRDISWFEAQEFINKYNLWLFEHARGTLPKNDESIGFLRLPTEIEWEFAARGGNAVKATVFDKKHPYPKKLSKYEWFAGTKSSRGKVKKIGLRQPNPLKIHDMLGNVSEMTPNFYQIEYYQGRIGGIVARGGNYRTEERSVNSSLRTEIPFYRNLKPIKQKTLGMRLVIASEIYVSLNTKAVLKEKWPEYQKTLRKAPVQPSQSLDPLVTQTDVQLGDALKSLERLRTELDQIPELPQVVLDQLGLLTASFKNVESMVRKAEHDSAYAWVKIATDRAFLANRALKKLPEYQKGLETAEKLGKTKFIDEFKARIKGANEDINEGLAKYGETFAQLEKSQESTVITAFERHSGDLKRRGAPTEQLAVTQLVKKHFQEYLQTRRLDAEKWRADLEKL